MEKSLRLLKLLSGNRLYSLQDLADRFEVSERTIYRYLNQIENAGYILERSEGHYRLVQELSNIRGLNELFHFTEEEVHIFYQALSTINADTELVNRLLKKLHSLYDFKALKDLTLTTNIEKVQLLSEGMKRSQQVILKNYRSSNSATISDRTVEPFSFMHDYKGIWCVDICDKKIKQFRLSRIDSIELLSHKWRYTHLHSLPFVDAFRMSAAKPLTNVKASLSLKAYNLLIEEYPLAEKYIDLKKEFRSYYLDIPIANYEGISRFVLGLLGDIKVKEPIEFKEFLKNKISISNL